MEEITQAVEHESISHEEKRKKEIETISKDIEKKGGLFEYYALIKEEILSEEARKKEDLASTKILFEL